MDGVLWRGAEYLPGVTEFFELLGRLGVPYVFATNNSGTEPEAYAARLRAGGVPGVSARQVVTSGTVMAEVLSVRYPSGTAVHVLGSPALKAALEEVGFVVSDPSAPGDVEVVVVGIDTTLTYDKLALAARRILNGAAFYGTNGDVSLPTAGGLAPGTGSILAALTAATGTAPQVVGKPERHIFRSAVHRLGSSPDRTLMVGDRLDTDVLGAQRSGMRTALLLTGVESPASAAASAVRADAVFADLPALSRAWGAARSAPGGDR